MAKTAIAFRPLALLLCLASVAPATEITDIRPDVGPLPRYARFQVEFDLSTDYGNPFDPNEVDARLTVITSTDDTVSVSAFWYQGFERANTGTDEILTQVGDPCWMARFTPTETGTHKYFIEVDDTTGYVKSDDSTFTCVFSDNRGFVRPYHADTRLFTFDDGSHYLPVGQNISWATNLGTYDYDTYFNEMSAHGENWARIWMTHFYRGQSLEWNEDHWTGYFHGIGVYSLECAWKLDYIVELARQEGIYLQLVTQHHGQFSTSVNPEWSENPYNVANGGILSSPDEFFTDTEAKDLYKRKMRYTVARWGYATSVLCWEFWNEVQYTDNYNATTVASWHSEMGQYVRALDPWEHMLTTSTRQTDAVIWSLPEIDCTQLHLYVGEITNSIRNMASSMWTYSKPVIVSEFGYYPHGDGWADTDGTHIHNGIWSAAMTMTGAMCWWWDNYIHPNDLYYHYAGLSGFFEGEDLRHPHLDTLHIVVDKPLVRGLPAVPKTTTSILRGYAVGGSNCAYVWVQDSGNTIGGTPQDSISGASMILTDMDAGSYDVLFWDTYNADSLGCDTVGCAGDTLELELPTFSLDLAVKLKRLEESGFGSWARPEGPEPFKLSVGPNPFSTGTRFRLAGCPGERATVSVCDVGGRLLWTADPGMDRVLDWCGVDIGGDPLSPGVYFATAKTVSRQAEAKVVILR